MKRPSCGGTAAGRYVPRVPTLTRWFLRAAIVNLVAGLALGLTLAVPSLADRAAPWHAAWIHLLVMGWATQMIFGVAYWMFPRKKPLDLRATDWLGWTCFVALNLGLLLRAISEPAVATGASGLAPTGLLLAAALQFAAVTAFVIQIWPRVTTR